MNHTNMDKVAPEDKSRVAVRVRSYTGFLKKNLLDLVSTEFDVIMEQFDPFTQCRLIISQKVHLHMSREDENDKSSPMILGLKFLVPTPNDEWDEEESFKAFCDSQGISFTEETKDEL